MNLRWASGVLLTLVISVQALFPGACQAEGENDPLWNKPSYDKKIIQVGQRILAANGIKERISFYYVNKEVRNADARRWFSPNTIRVFKDLTDIVSSDDELAAILAHEIAHIVNRHTRKAYLRKTPIILGTLALMGAATAATGGLAAPLAVGMGGEAIVRPIDRGLETNADMTGLDLMVKAGYNPLAMETIMTKLTADAGIFTSFFSAHPLGTKRISRIHEAIKLKYPQFMTDELANNPVPGSPYQLQLPQYKEKKKKKKKDLQQVKETDKPAENASASESGKPGDSKVVEKATPRPEQTASAKTPEAEQTAGSKKPLAAAEQGSQTEPVAAVSIAEEKTEGAAAEGTTAKKTAAANQAEGTQSHSSESSALKPAPAKISYTATKSALKKAPTSRNYNVKTASPKSALASAGSSGTINARKSSAVAIALVLLELSSDQQKALKLIAKRHYMSREDLEAYFPGWEPDLLDAVINGLVQKRLIRIVGGDETDHGYILTDSASVVLEGSE